MIFTVHVKSNASQSKIISISGNAITLATTKIPNKGEANKDIIRLLSKEFHVPKTLITIISGETSKIKRIKIPQKNNA